jgi:hypothetical protein
MCNQSHRILPHYHNTLAARTLIILFSEMLKSSKKVNSEDQNIVNENTESSRIFNLLE